MFYTHNFLNVNDKLYKVYRTFRKNGWFTNAMNGIGAQELCDVYGVELIVYDDNLYYLVNECRDVEFTNV